MTVRDRRQLFDLDFDRLERVLGLRLGVGDHHGDRLADVADLVLRDDRLKIVLEFRQVGQPQRDDRDALPDIRGGDDRMHARHGARGRRVDPAKPAVRHAAAHNHRMQHAVALEIVDKGARPSEKSQILGPMNGAADQRGRVHRGFFPAARAIA